MINNKRYPHVSTNKGVQSRMQNDSSTRHVSSLSLSRRNILQKVFDFKKNPNFNFGIYVIDKFQLIEKEQLLVHFLEIHRSRGRGLKLKEIVFLPLDPLPLDI